MKKIILLTLSFCFSALLLAQQPYTVFLIGDAGKQATPGATLQMLKAMADTTPNSSVIFMGDNVYPAGLHLSKTPGDTTESERNLLSQLQVVNNHPGYVFFVPGNHDWDEQLPGGLKAVKEEEKYIENYVYTGAQTSNDPEAKRLQFAPTAGLPGPESFSPVKGLRYIFIDTQWFLHFHKKDKLPGKSKKETADIFFNRLDSMLAASAALNERVVLLYHHPLFTNGGHGTAKQPLRFLVNYTPFQLLGLIGANRLLSQDIPQPRFKRMRNRFFAIEAKYKGIINASGHEHFLQFFQNGDDHYIVSGSGSKLSHKKMNKYPDLFTEDQQGGLVKLLYYPDGKVVAEYWGATDKKLLKSFILE